MSPLLVPGAVLAAEASISVSAQMAARPPLISARCKRDMPAGLPKLLLASWAADERPAKDVPMPQTLCSLMARPLAINWQEAEATAIGSVVLNQTWLIITVGCYL